MKIAAAFLLASLAWAQAPLKTAAVVSPAERPKTTRQAVTDVEKRLDARINMIGGADPVYVLGLTRGLYLPGYGAVFTAELDLIPTPIPNPFRPKITPEEAVKVHQRKIEHLALLKKSMHDMWVDAASSLTSLPDTDQIVVAVRLFYQPWEDMNGLPAQIVMKGPRKAALSGNIQTEEQ